MKKKYDWERYSDEKLLDLPISKLGIKLEDTPLIKYCQKMHQELEGAGISFKPHFWLSTSWFCPDGVPGVAIPFYLAHPRLKKLEAKMVYEVEGGTPKWFMQLLRHEVGHALDNAFGLRRKKERQKIFGKSTQAYHWTYDPKPYSKKYVVHLDGWYAQSHPDEDFAETFAVWLSGNKKWKDRYKNWPAIKKLELMDRLMEDLKDKKQIVRNRYKQETLRETKITLREYYIKKRDYMGLEYPSFFDRDLNRLFSSSAEFKNNMNASSFLRKNQKEIRRKVAKWTNLYQYTVAQVIEDMIDRCDDLELKLCDSPEETKQNFNILLTVAVMNYLKEGYHRMVR